MVTLEIADDTLALHVRGFDKLWSFQSALKIPLAHIADVRTDPAVAHSWSKGIRAPGTHIPGVIVAGTFYQDGKRVFWDVHNPDNTIIISLRDERYDELIVEVPQAAAAVKLIKDALPSTRTECS